MTLMEKYKIEEQNTLGCEQLSRLYGDMFNLLQKVMQDENVLSKLNPIDYSALGLYIGKFVEQEINTSVVQLMRKFCGISMPKFFCIRDSSKEASVKYRNKVIRLNEQKIPVNKESLKLVMLGDAYYALNQLKYEDRRGFFDEYLWLKDKTFLESWRNLFRFRNKVAHTGEIISMDDIKEGIGWFSSFLKFMPQMLELKKSLAPDLYFTSSVFENLIEDYSHEDTLPYIVSMDDVDLQLPCAPIDEAIRFCGLIESLNEYNMGMVNELLNKYYFGSMIFVGDDGKKGLKNCLGNIIVPAKYDGFPFLPDYLSYRKSSIAVRNGKYVVVPLDGSDVEYSKGDYDLIVLADETIPQSPYLYKKDGHKSWGCMSMIGEEVSGCIIDKINGAHLETLIFMSGDYYGLWQFRTIFLPPIYDNIELFGEYDEDCPFLFTLDGEPGFVKYDHSFFRKSDYDKMDEDEQLELSLDFVTTGNII